MLTFMLENVRAMNKTKIKLLQEASLEFKIHRMISDGTTSWLENPERHNLEIERSPAMFASKGAPGMLVSKGAMVVFELKGATAMFELNPHSDEPRQADKHLKVGEEYFPRDIVPPPCQQKGGRKRRPSCQARTQ
uniref:Uncharacterized protein n=1 Tax=Salix viminalis TaxID=40686 RepID=A0A6N2LWW5_SALVM